VNDSRTHEEIESAILSAIGNSYNDNKGMKGATKMEIMAGAFVTHECVTGYLERLEKEGLIDYSSGTGVYMVTDKGKQRLGEREK